MSNLNTASGYQLPNALRESMLQAGAGKSLVVLEGLYACDYKPETWLTFDEIFTLCREHYGASYQMVYQGLRNENIFQRHKIAPISGQRGARPYVYRIPHPAELMVEFGVTQKYSPHDKLEKADLKSVSDYRKGLHRELFKRKWLENNGNGFVMSRKLMAERLGVSPRTVRTYDKKLNFSNEPNYKEVPITDENWYKLPRYKDKFDENGKKLPSKIWLKIMRYGESPQILPNVRYLAYKALKEDYYVYQVERLPNTYFPYQKPDLSEIDRYDVAGRFWAEKAARNAAGFYQRHDSKWYYRQE